MPPSDSERSPAQTPKRRNKVVQFPDTDPRSTPSTKRGSKPRSARTQDKSKTRSLRTSGRLADTTIDLQGQGHFYNNSRIARARRFSIPVWVFKGLQLAILGVGLGVLGGTVLANLPARYSGLRKPPSLGKPETTARVSEVIPSQTETNSQSLEPLTFTQEITPLKQQVTTLMAAAPSELTPGIFLVDLDNRQFVDIRGTESFSAASTIKVPVLVAFFEDVDARRIQLEEPLTMRPDLIASGSGGMQYETPSSQYSALEVATQMIVVSDNTATNMLIDRLGGKEALNQRFQDWGLQHTILRAPLPDLEGTNTTSPRDLSLLLTRIANGEIVSLQSRDRLLAIMRQTVTDTLLPQGLEESATISHKTGDIGSLVGDTGLIDMANGKRYVVTALVKRPDNDNRAQEIIRQTSKTIYSHFKATSPQPAKASPTPSLPLSVPSSSSSPEQASPEASPLTNGEFEGL